MVGQQSNPEVDLGLGKVSEVTQEQIEQFQEALKKAQAAMQKLQKDEKKAKKRDTALAGLLSKFVKGNKDKDILLLIILCLELGFPVNVILALLSLAYEDIRKELSEQLEKEPVALPTSEKKFLEAVEEEEKKDLEIRQKFDEHNLPDHVKKRVNEWVKDILLLSLEQQKRTLETVYAGNTPHMTAIQLATKCLEKYLLAQNIEGEFERLRAFSEFIMKGIGKELAKSQAASDKQLETTEKA